ncbi:uncharacterized protein BT62DRAFT_605269 [Guyanagaster necrorhizus]|uniref:Uncharacterized protein n=1 Tax=Guyanagaster necrorhizus TaxID=856835 RepID=A0A9P7VY75_9AGAR|nr:uncharacterized protein BT62DRAFT_605269 [Guyanagaster necrorhizus MCA 3950]KAG7449746.1 hypothetical protein BT62DRAFT_605269 [Guyanagaster necrorhizus MCA 3950]
MDLSHLYGLEALAHSCPYACFHVNVRQQLMVPTGAATGSPRGQVPGPDTDGGRSQVNGWVRDRLVFLQVIREVFLRILYVQRPTVLCKNQTRSRQVKCGECTGHIWGWNMSCMNDTLMNRRLHSPLNRSVIYDEPQGLEATLPPWRILKSERSVQSYKVRMPPIASGGRDSEATRNGRN